MNFFQIHDFFKFLDFLSNFMKILEFTKKFKIFVFLFFSSKVNFLRNSKVNTWAIQGSERAEVEQANDASWPAQFAHVWAPEREPALKAPKVVPTKKTTCGWMVRMTLVSLVHQKSLVARIYSEFISEFLTMRVQWEKTFPLTTERL